MKSLFFGFFLSLCLLNFSHESQAALTVDSLTYTHSLVEIENSRFYIFGHATGYPNGYQLSNGAFGKTDVGGMFNSSTTTSNHFERDGANINYSLDEPTSYYWPNGRHFAMAIGLLDLNNNLLGRFSLKADNAAPLILRAEYGTRNASISGLLTVIEPESWWLSDSNFLPTSGYGSVVPFSLDYELLAGSVWDENTFNSNSSFNIRGKIDFSAAPVVTPEPIATILMVIGGVFMIFVNRYKFLNRQSAAA